MQDNSKPPEEFVQEQELPVLCQGQFGLIITVDLEEDVIRFEWKNARGGRAGTGRVRVGELNFTPLEYVFEGTTGKRQDFCYGAPGSVRGMLNRIRESFPVAAGTEQLGLLTPTDLGSAKAGVWLPIKLRHRATVWSWLAKQLQYLARTLEYPQLANKSPAEQGKAVLHLLGCSLLDAEPTLPGLGFARRAKMLRLQVTFNQVEGFAEFDWRSPQSGETTVCGRITCTAPDQLTWHLRIGESNGKETTLGHRNSIRGVLRRWLERFPTDLGSFRGFWVQPDRRSGKPITSEEQPFPPGDHPYQWIEDNVVAMAEALRFKFSPLGRLVSELNPEGAPDADTYFRKWERKQQKLAAEETRRQQMMAQLAEERRLREAQKAAARADALAQKQAQEKTASEAKARTQALTMAAQQTPPVPLRLQMPTLEFQETVFPLASLKAYFLRETASRWWISNQSDDLLCLPHCRIEHLEYQLRTALRVLGPLRGRALLSDEVGLGKTIEAGLVIKELFVRGMAKRVLVLTVPSLVDQWEEELSEKFGLPAATTNQVVAREAPEKFWNDNTAIVASLHTLKQPAHLAIAQQLTWDILVVDEAHYLRNRDSQAWQAVNALPRQFLLLLTATPVQNSLEELYNLVTLLQPGFLPSPREFRRRFLDPKRPRQPREPEELRRMLGQVMIRNTRANAGIGLPPRHAETVLFEPDPAEKTFGQEWETEFRTALTKLNASQASLWGRLVLQAAGSSPAAWRSSLSRFPERAAAELWTQAAHLKTSWEKKCALIPPLTQVEGGLVIFTQFLQTQSALAEFLQAARIQTHVINGQTPPANRQPITENFRRQGGALLLTHSGTEGRNLQFCHRLVNFDLPWNPMEIEQRIGRLHRLGQKHPVRIFNLVQADTLQEHLLELLQEKLNLFELVVGETGLVLGDRFSSEEFAEEVLRCWRQAPGKVGEALSSLGQELAAAREQYTEVKKLDETLFAKDYELL